MAAMEDIHRCSPFLVSSLTVASDVGHFQGWVGEKMEKIKIIQTRVPGAARRWLGRETVPALNKKHKKYNQCQKVASGHHSKLRIEG